MAALVTRRPTKKEFEQLRLILSTFTDGSGYQMNRGRSYPGWRDFERATAAAFGGICGENKEVFDVLLPSGTGKPVGISCKCSKAGASQDYVLFELHNSFKKAHDYLDERSIRLRKDPRGAGIALIEQVEEWHQSESGKVNLMKSSYFALVHDSSWTKWRVFWFPLDLRVVDPRKLKWSISGNRLEGIDTKSGHLLWQWYPKSGGQLKFQVPIEYAKWASEWFELERARHVDLATRAKTYFRKSWPA